MARRLMTTGETIEVEIRIYDICKYEKESKVTATAVYNDVEEWEIVSGEDDLMEFEKQGLIDDHHEYLILHFTDGDTATFRNSYVDMFKVW